MRKLFRFLRDRLFEHVYFLIGLPIALLLFVLVTFGWTAIFVPIFFVLLVGLLQIMQWIAEFEIKRGNLFLRSEIRIIENWFSYPLFTWNGVKERLLSARSWLAIIYAFPALVIALVGFAFSAFTLAYFGSFLVVAPDLLIALATGQPIAELLRTSSIQLGGADIEAWGIQITENLGFAEMAFITALYFVLSSLFPVVSASAVWGLGKLQVLVINALLSNGILPSLEKLAKRTSNRIRISDRDVREALSGEALREDLAELTDREIEILSLMTQGKSNAGIAKALFITEGSVEKHVSNILAKLGLPVQEDAHRRVQAVLAYLKIEPANADTKP
jgi:DNA-binding CsgD family transcriptional regulator